MTIGIDASRANKFHKTGTEWYSYYLIEELKRIDKKNHYFLYSKELLQSGLEQLSENWESKVLNWPPRYLWTQIRLSLEMLRYPPDLLFVPAHALPLVHPRKTVTTCHDIGFERFPELYSPLELRYHRFSMRLAIKKAIKIITPSEFTKNEIIEFYRADPRKFVVIPHGYNKERYKVIEDIGGGKSEEGQRGVEGSAGAVLKKYKIQRPFILYIGRLEKKKNTAGLIEAFHELGIRNQESGKLKLVLVGEPGYGFFEVEEKIKKYNLEDKVIMPGWVSEEELPYLFYTAELFILPSFYEGFGLPVLEAMACGTPVVASRVASIPEVGGEAIEYFNPWDIDEMVEKIRKVLEDKNLRDKLRRKGLERVEEFSWEKCARKTLEVLENIK